MCPGKKAEAFPESRLRICPLFHLSLLTQLPRDGASRGDLLRARPHDSS
jgi:hypothetical protein